MRRTILAAAIAALAIAPRADAAGRSPLLFPGLQLFQLGDGAGLFAEDSAHVSGHRGVFVLGVRNDAGTSLCGTTGDYCPFQLDSTGQVRVVAPLPSGAATEATLLGIKTGTDKIPSSPATDRATAA